MAYYKTQEWQAFLPYEKGLYSEEIKKLTEVAPYLTNIRTSSIDEDYSGYDLVSNEGKKTGPQHISLRSRHNVKPEWIREITLRESELKRIKAGSIDFFFYVLTTIDEYDKDQIVGYVLIDLGMLSLQVNKNGWDCYINHWHTNKGDTRFASIGLDTISSCILVDNAKKENVIALMNHYKQLRQPIEMAKLRKLWAQKSR
jgi:hypothetical protein